MKISILGSGAWGTAIALLLRDNGHSATIWSKFEYETEALKATRKNPLLKDVEIPEDIHIISDICQAAHKAESVILAVPSYALRETVEALQGRVEDGCLVICMSKGIEMETSSLFTGIIKGVLGERTPTVVVSGPTHAEEVARRIPTACVAASREIDIAERVQGLLMNEYFRVYTSIDVIGVELGGALKNVIALGAGICDGLGFGDNTMAALMTRGLAEIAEMCVHMGGRKETLAGLAGLGDLIVTCMSRHSRNRRAGLLIGKGMTATDAIKEVGSVVEGYYAAKAARDLSVAMSVEMPICVETYKVLYEHKDPLIAIKSLMGRSGKSEYATGEQDWVTR